ncbi:MAG: hypothetical protein LBT50_00245 [Prevotellaceae bacterium]|jgi:hypothetical protein|nr:hypothetical protein [Prevotellaceae bacterium]
MRKFFVKTIAVISFAITGFTGCTNDSYLVDGGKSNPVFDGTVLDFIESRPDYFDTLRYVIKIAGMEQVFEEEDITFFAPPDYSITKCTNMLNQYLYLNGRAKITDLAQIKSEVWREFLGLYIIKDKYLLKDITQIDTAMISAFGGQAYISYNGRPMNMGVVYHDIKDGNTVIKYAGYRQLLYSYIYDFTEHDMQNAYVATSDIRPSNGVVHVLRFEDHSFGFSYNFVISAITAGIDYGIQ